MAEDDRYPSQLAERFQVRLPDGMRDRLKAEAEANKRSMNTEIVARLEVSLDQQADAAVLFAQAKVDIAGSAWPSVARDVSMMGDRVDNMSKAVFEIKYYLEKLSDKNQSREEIAQLEKRCAEREAEIDCLRAELLSLRSSNAITVPSPRGASDDVFEQDITELHRIVDDLRPAVTNSSSRKNMSRNEILLALKKLGFGSKSDASGKAERLDAITARIAAVSAKFNEDVDADLEWTKKIRARERNINGDHSTNALIKILRSMLVKLPDFMILYDEGWPRRFSSLPADTRAALIGALNIDAPAIYEAFVVIVPPASPSGTSERFDNRERARGEQMNSVRRLQHAFLPSEAIALGEGCGPDETDTVARRARA